MELASKYDPKEVESKWYQYWLDNKLFASKPDGREPYTIVIPPPNVTGVLHMDETLAGMVLHYCESIPEQGEELEIGHYRVKILKASDTKLDEVELKSMA